MWTESVWVAREKEAAAPGRYAARRTVGADEEPSVIANTGTRRRHWFLTVCCVGTREGVHSTVSTDDGELYQDYVEKLYTYA